MDICLESFNPYRDVETINEGTNIFSKALEILSKIWHKILDTITGFLNKFKKNKKVTEAQFRKICKDKGITEINVSVIKNLGKMFKSNEHLMVWIERVGEGLDFITRFLASPGGDGKFVDRINEMIHDMGSWYTYFLNYTSTRGFDINDPKSLKSFAEIIESVMITKDYDGTTIPISNENILSWTGTGYSFEQIFDDDMMNKIRIQATKSVSVLDSMMNRLDGIKMTNAGKINEKRFDMVKLALSVILKTNAAVCKILNAYTYQIAIIRGKVFTIMNSSDANENKNVSECFAYIR